MGLLVTPTVISSIDDSIDTTEFYSISEEEENSKIKLLFDKNNQTLESLIEDKTTLNLTGYMFKQYPNPQLNVVFPPPDFI
ncbi:hypothetical protein [Winogradskyella vidalii]|uniref:hypothetical protein n=1 Tax=Winogradskyella vidalii TaxID=2615024 RepID=UPI0015CB4B4A|nr:hypothetical protein [Winogradskyella vidalii]